MEEVQRIREALAEGRPVLSEAQRDLIRQQTTFLGEGGDAVMRVIQEDAMKPGCLPADVARVIEKCCQDIGRRVALREMSNETEKEKEPERLLQLEGLQAQVSKYAVAKDREHGGPDEGKAGSATPSRNNWKTWRRTEERDCPPTPSRNGGRQHWTLQRTP